MSPTAATQSVAEAQAPKKQLCVPSLSATMMLGKAAGLPSCPSQAGSWGALELPGFHALCPDTKRAADVRPR